tara:strand:+ start:94 stop:702 length:609 start_codon:yes stop_codon:yes gene_type:complete
MKKLLLMLFITTLFQVNAQKIKSVESFDLGSITNKKEWKKYKNPFEMTELKTDFGVFKVGESLVLGSPSDSNINSDFKFVMVGRQTTMNALAAVFMSNSDSNLEVIIDKIKIYKPFMGQPLSIVVEFKRKDGANIALGKFGNITNLSKAISLGEIINPNRPMNRQEAIAKLKEAKDLLDLDMMSQEEFDALKAKLTPIIKGN